jgi:hypothetical protein
MVKILVLLIKHILRRGHGVFKLLFVIDDFIRLFAMTLLFGMLAWRFNASGFLTVALVGLGIFIDMHDFLTENKIIRTN